MPKKPFSQSTKAKIRRRCQYRCVICVRRLGETGRCAHILDSSNAGANMVSDPYGQSRKFSMVFRSSSQPRLVCSMPTIVGQPLRMVSCVSGYASDHDLCRDHKLTEYCSVFLLSSRSIHTKSSRPFPAMSSFTIPDRLYPVRKAKTYP